MKKSEIFWQTYLNLEKEVLELSRYILFTDEILVNEDNRMISKNCDTQLNAFSPHIADLVVRCCVEIEAISKELYFENGGIKERGDTSIQFDTDCLKLIDKKWQTHNKTVLVVSPSFNFTKDINRILKPLKEAHKKQGTYWEKAYQAVKHDRYSSLYKGNIKALIHSLAALYLLNIYYRNDTWTTSFQDVSKIDYSVGSAIFAVTAPATEQPWYGNIPITSQSPYVISYIDSSYKQIEEIQNREKQSVSNFLANQPEMEDPGFHKQLNSVIKENRYGITVFIELGKYRLNKMLPNSLDFEERKSNLIKSEAWNSWIHQNNKHLSEDDISIDNIQDEIDSAGAHWGLTLLRKTQKLEWLPMALNDNICEVYIPN